MKIAYVVETYTDGLGYIDNLLPSELAGLGAEVHVFTCRLPPYYSRSAGHFGALLDAQNAVEETIRGGAVIHTLGFHAIGNRIVMAGLGAALRRLRPDAVLVRGISSPVLGQVILWKALLGYRVVTSTGQAYSAVPAIVRNSDRFSIAGMKHVWPRICLGKVFSLFITKCIPSVEDGGDALVEFYGVPRKKVMTISLGVDTGRFYPVGDQFTAEERRKTRAATGIGADEFVVIWTGRMEIHKGIGLLARAVEELYEQGYPVRCLFIGSGPAADSLHGHSRSIHLPFMPWSDLPAYYRAADVAVWPHSITTSTLDASACGLPVIMSNREKARERWDGIGAVYEHGDIESLKAAIISFHDEGRRHAVGACGALLMRQKFSWPVIARRFLDVVSRSGA